jgi:DNA-directed RNA polymerase subunit RPC12/RpoP
VKKFRLLTWTLTSAAVRFSSYEVRRVPKIMRWALPESMLMDLHFVDGILDHFSTVWYCMSCWINVEAWSLGVGYQDIPKKWYVYVCYSCKQHLEQVNIG